MKKAIWALLPGLAVAACGHVSKYEEGVIDYEPTYCYAALGEDVECFREPVLSEGRRLVNYYGKHPSRYGEPPAKSQPAYGVPPRIDTWVKDPEPVVKPFVYLDAAHGEASAQGTQALVRQAHENLTSAIRKESLKQLNSSTQAESGGAGASGPSSAGAPPFR